MEIQEELIELTEVEMVETDGGIAAPSKGGLKKQSIAAAGNGGLRKKAIA